MVFIGFKVYEVGVNQRACYASVSKSFLDMQSVFPSVILHCFAEMPQSVKGYSFHSWVLQCVGDSLSLEGEVLSELVELNVSPYSLRSLR